MRWTLGISILAALLFSFPAAAQQWIDYVNPDYRFAVNFPVAPMEEDLEHNGTNGDIVPARRFTAELDGNIYRVTVAVFPEGADVLGEIENAAQALRARGEVNHDLLSDYDGVPAHEISVVDTQGRQILATILFHDRHLIIAEGNVGPDDFPPVQFQQSVYATDASGTAIKLE